MGTITFICNRDIAYLNYYTFLVPFNPTGTNIIDQVYTGYTQTLRKGQTFSIPNNVTTFFNVDGGTIQANPLPDVSKKRCINSARRADYEKKVSEIYSAYALGGFINTIAAISQQDNIISEDPTVQVIYGIIANEYAQDTIVYNFYSKTQGNVIVNIN